MLHLLIIGSSSVNFINPGDTFSGLASFDRCLDAPDHQVSLVISAAQGNTFRGSFVTKPGVQILMREVRGFVHAPSRQVIIVPDVYDSNAMSLVCSYKADTNNDVDCKLLTDYMSTDCGAVSLNRDRTGLASVSLTMQMLASPA